jgi:hypothetical protein
MVDVQVPPMGYATYQIQPAPDGNATAAAGSPSLALTPVVHCTVHGRCSLLHACCLLPAFHELQSANFAADAPPKQQTAPSVDCAADSAAGSRVSSMTCVTVQHAAEPEAAAAPPGAADNGTAAEPEAAAAAPGAADDGTGVSNDTQSSSGAASGPAAPVTPASTVRPRLLPAATIAFIHYSSISSALWSMRTAGIVPCYGCQGFSFAIRCSRRTYRCTIRV